MPLGENPPADKVPMNVYTGAREVLLLESIQPQTCKSPSLLLAALRSRKLGLSKSVVAERMSRSTVVFSVSDSAYGGGGSDQTAQPNKETRSHGIASQWLAPIQCTRGVSRSRCDSRIRHHCPNIRPRLCGVMESRAVDNPTGTRWRASPTKAGPL